MNKNITNEIKTYRKDDFVAGCNAIIDNKDKSESEKKMAENALLKHVSATYPNLFSK